MGIEYENEDVHNFHFQYPTPRHNDDLKKYTSGLLPTYIVIGIIATLAYVLRRKVLHHRERLIKLSNVSRLTLKVLISRLIFDVFYLFYLVLFRFFLILSHKYYYLFFVVLDQLLEVGVFYAIMCVFVQGYLTLHFNKKVLRSRFSIATLSLYLVSVFFIRVYARSLTSETRHNNIDRMYEFDIQSLNINTAVILISVYTIACRTLLSFLIFKQFWSSYKEYNHNEKFLKTFLILTVAYLLSPYIRVPTFAQGDNFWDDYLKNLFIGDGKVQAWGTTSVPEIIQLFTGAIVIYIWRDSSFIRPEDQNDI